MGRHVHNMYMALQNKEILIFSAADNSLPKHIRLTSWAIRQFKHTGLSCWLHLNIKRLIAKHHLLRINIHTGPGGVFLIRPVPVPVIVTAHHTYWQQSHYIRTQFWKRLFIPFERKTFQLAEKIICDCYDTKNVLIKHYSTPEEKITVIPCAIESSKFYPMGTAKQPNRLQYLSRLDKRKGIDFLIKSMQFVRQEIPEATLFVGGTGRHLEKMKTLVRHLHLENNVTFLGFVPDDQLNTLYNQAQCVVVPSIFEGFGITAIEAIAAGTRVIGSDVDGIREILRKGDYGRLVPYGNLRALADAIVAELKSPGIAGELQPEYKFDHFKEQYLHLFSDFASSDC
jgi:glycosyltransferase involved in cell wall biosynthesis